MLTDSNPCSPVNWRDTVNELDSGSSLGDLSVDQGVILSWGLGCLLTVIFLNIEYKQRMLHGV